MQLIQAIKPIAFNVTYAKARKLAREAGGVLPSNVLHDDILLRSENWKALAKTGYFDSGAWNNEISAHAGAGKIISKGQGLVDSQTRMFLPFDEAYAVADKDFTGIKGVGLVVIPKEITVENGREVVHPEKVIVYSARVEIFGVAGKVDEETRMPLDMGLENLEKQMEKNIDPLPSESLRWAYCFMGEAVRPVKRYVHDFRRGIFEISWNQENTAAAGIVEPLK